MRIKTLAALLLMTASNAFASEYREHIVMVLDDSGTVQDETGNGATNRPAYTQARWQLIGNLDRTYRADSLVTIISVARPQVIWQGPASEATHRNNHVLANYLKEEVNGCADFIAVLDSIKRELRYAPAPLTELLFFSSLVHTGGRNSKPDGCAVDPDHLQPPDEFFAGLSEVQEKTRAELKFHWTYDEVAPVVADYFDAQGVRVEVLQEKRTLAELYQ